MGLCFREAAVSPDALNRVKAGLQNVEMGHFLKFWQRPMTSAKMGLSSHRLNCITSHDGLHVMYMYLRPPVVLPPPP